MDTPQFDLQGLLGQFQPTEQDRRDAVTQALAAMGFGLLGGGNGNNWQAIGRAGAQGLGTYNAALQQSALSKRQSAQNALNAMQVQREYQDLQDDAATRKVLSSYQTPAPLPSMAPTTQNAAALAAQPQPSMYDRLNGIADALEKQGLAKRAFDYRQMAEKYAPKFTGTKTVMQNGKPVLMQEYSNQAPNAVQGFQPTPDTQLVDLGGRFVAVDKNQVQPGTDFAKGMTPGEVASNNLGWANYGLGKQRLAMEQSNQAADNAKLQFITGNDGTIYAVNPRTGTGGPALGADSQPLSKGAKSLTEVQGNATAFGMRMQSANDIINGLEDSGADLSHPINLLAANRLTNYAASPTAQKAYAAKLNFMTASLRKESGAAISKSEFESEDKKYFPQPGDSQQVINQKRQARALAIQAMEVQAGPGIKNITGSNGGWSIRQVP
jgi:hypothetical protein